MSLGLNSNQKKFVDLMTDEIIYTNQEMADMIGIDVRTIYRWRKNQKVTDAINKQADVKLGQYINLANRTLMQVMEEGTEHAQLKAVDMLFKTLGKYTEQSEITINETKSVEERKASLMDRLRG